MKWLYCLTLRAGDVRPRRQPLYDWQACGALYGAAWVRDRGPIGLRARLRLAVAGCSTFTGPALASAYAYEGLADVVEVPCETQTDDPDAHLDEPETALTPAVAEQLRRDPPDVIVVPPGHRGWEPGLEPDRFVPVRLDPACLLGEHPPLTGPSVLVLRPALASSLLVAAIASETPRSLFLPALSAEHLRAQLAVVRRTGAAEVVTEPAAVPLLARMHLPARAYLDPPSQCVVVHAIELALLRAALLRLRQPLHGAVGVDLAPFAGLTGRSLDPPPGFPGSPEVLALRTARRFVIVPQATISYVSSLGGVTSAYTDTGRLWSDLTLSELERRLDARRFLRVDQSHIVNLTRVAELVPWTHQRYRLVFADAAKTELTLSRDVGRRLRAALGW